MKFLDDLFKSKGYRPDVDGIRALAIVAIMLGHAWPGHFQAALFCVDIFFVISGYLITSIILRDVEKKHFSFKNFYQRRIVRILPTLIFILLVTLTAGFLLLTAEEYAHLGSNVTAGAFLWSNFDLMSEAGYFDVSSTLKPLLHLWTLSIELQFYIIYPLLLILAARFSMTVFFLLVVIGLSFIFGPGISEWLFGPTAGGASRYYSPLTRMGDLGVGALLALLTKRGRLVPKHGTLFAIAGLSLLVASCFLVDTSKPWPSTLTLLPVAGIALIIYAGPTNFISRTFLANRPVVFIGAIAYELYLCHWPILAFANILAGGSDHVGIPLKIALLVCAVAVAYFMLIYWVMPIREKCKGSFGLGILLICVLVAIGGAGYFVARAKGLPGRIDTSSALKPWNLPKVREDVARAAPHFPEWIKYTDEPNQVAMDASLDQIDIALIGDSHALQLYPGLSEGLSGSKKLGVFPASGQAPFLGVATFTDKMTNYRKNGYRLINKAYRTVIENPKIETVILVHCPDGSLLDTIDLENPNDSDINGIMEQAMRRSLEALQNAGKKVLLVLDNPTLEFDPTVLQPRPLKFLGGSRMVNRKEAEVTTSRLWYKKLCEKMADEFDNVKIVDLFDAFCSGNVCITNKNGQPLYWDRNHLTVAGSRVAAPLLLKALKNI